MFYGVEYPTGHFGLPAPAMLPHSFFLLTGKAGDKERKSMT